MKNSIICEYFSIILKIFLISLTGQQEPYMEVVNPFILKNKERMIVFLDQLSSVQDPNPPPGSYIESSTSHLCADAGLLFFLHFFLSLSLPNANWMYIFLF